MNAYYDKTFVINSSFVIDIKYYNEKMEEISFPAKYTAVDLVFTNTQNSKELVMKNVGTINGGHIRIEASGLAWSEAPSGFYKNNITDIFGVGGKWHNYGIWLRSSISNESMNVLRGAAKLVRGR